MYTAAVMGVHPAPRPPCGLPAHRDGLPTPQGSQMRRGSQEIQGGPPPQSTFRTFSSSQRTPAAFPSSPRGNLGPPRCGRPASVLVWPLSLSITVSRLVCVSLTPLCARVDSALCTHHVQLAHMSADTGWPRRLAAANLAAVNVRVSVWMWILTSLGHVPGSGIAVSLVTLSLAV